MRLVCSAYWLSLVKRLLLPVLFQMPSSLGSTPSSHENDQTRSTTTRMQRPNTARNCTTVFCALGYVTLRYCTLNNCRGSVHTRSTVKPAALASCANSSSVYLYELSVQMLSPSLKEISLSPMRTVWFFRLTRCISMRLCPGL